MSVGTYIAIYFLIWWLVIFAVLPFGVRSQHEAGAVEDGTEPGAPQQPYLLRKMAITTVIAGLILGVFAWSIESGWLTLDMLPVPIKLY